MWSLATFTAVVLGASVMVNALPSPRKLEFEYMVLNYAPN